MLTNLIIFSIICLGNAFLIIGFNRACQYDIYENDQHFVRGNEVVEIKKGEPKEETKMILWRVKYYSEKWLGDFWSKPVYSCPTCMASLHGLVPFIFTETIRHNLNMESILHWAFYTLVLSGLTTFINER